jgi:acyl-CoA thioester hydrolase
MRELTLTRRIEFADTDMAGIAHFARFFVFMETAEHRFREALGVPVHPRAEPVTLTWPRVAASCDYRSPVRFGEELEIVTRVVAMGRSSLTFGFTFTVGERLVAEGRLTSVCCRLEPAVRAVPIPEEVVRVIEVAEG